MDVAILGPIAHAMPANSRIVFSSMVTGPISHATAGARRRCAARIVGEGCLLTRDRMD